MQLFLIHGCGMLAVALLAAFLWRRRTVAGWRWFWIGAAIWTAGVAGKLIWSVMLNPLLLGAIKGYGPTSASPFLGGAYLGVNSAVWEIGITGIAALRWRGMVQNADRAAGVGVGAGAFEAGLLGVASTISVVLAIFGGPYSQQITEFFVQSGEHTPLVWLTGPAERVIAILLHVSTRMLVLLAVVQHRWWLFWGGFGFFALGDGIAGYFLVSGILATTSVWWVEFTLLPVVVVSLLIIGICYRRWPVTRHEPSPESRTPEGVSATKPRRIRTETSEPKSRV